MDALEVKQRFTNLKNNVKNDNGALIATADELIRLARQQGMIPRDTGALESSSVVVQKSKGHVQIIMKVPYSQRQFYEHISLSHWWPKTYKNNKMILKAVYAEWLNRSVKG